MKKNTLLCMDITTWLFEDAMPQINKLYPGMLRVINEDEVEFVETNTLTTRVKRNPQVFNGRYITVTQWDDGSLHPHLKQVRITPGFNLHNYILGIGRELRLALKGLVKK